MLYRIVLLLTFVISQFALLSQIDPALTLGKEYPKTKSKVIDFVANGDGEVVLLLRQKIRNVITDKGEENIVAHILNPQMEELRTVLHGDFHSAISADWPYTTEEKKRSYFFMQYFKESGRFLITQEVEGEKNDKFIYLASAFDPFDSAGIVGPKPIFEVNYANSDAFGPRRRAYFRPSGSLAQAQLARRSRDDRYKILIFVINQELELEWDFLADFPFAPQGIYLDNIFLASDGIIYCKVHWWPGKKSEQRKLEKEIGYKYRRYLLSYSSEGKLLGKRELIEEKGKILAEDYLVRDDGKLIRVGLYGNKKKNHVEGAFYTEFSKKDLSEVKENYQPFSGDMKTWADGILGRGTTMKFMYASTIWSGINTDGFLTMVVEKRNSAEFEHRDQFGNTTNTSTEAHGLDQIILRFSPSGELFWSQVNPRRLIGKYFSDWHMYTRFFEYDFALYFLALEHGDNEEMFDGQANFKRRPVKMMGIYSLFLGKYSPDGQPEYKKELVKSKSKQLRTASYGEAVTDGKGNLYFLLYPDRWGTVIPARVSLD